MSASEGGPRGFTLGRRRSAIVHGGLTKARLYDGKYWASYSEQPQRNSPLERVGEMQHEKCTAAFGSANRSRSSCASFDEIILRRTRLPLPLQCRLGGHVVLAARLSLPVFPNEQTFSGAVGMSQRCQYRLLRQSRRSYCLCLQPR
jgi:hypothetical protein